MRKGSEDTPRSATARRAYPGPDMGAEDEWTQEVRGPPDRAAAPRASEAPDAAHRARHRPDASEAPSAAHRRHRPDASEAATQRVRPRSIAERQGPAPRRLAPPAPAA